MKTTRKTFLIAFLTLALSFVVGIPAYAEEVDNNDTGAANSVNQVAVTSQAENVVLQNNEANTNDSSATAQVQEEVQVSNVPMYNGLFYTPDAFLTADQNVAMLTLSTNDPNVRSAYFRVWTGDGSNMRGYNAYFQPDGRFMAFVSVNDFKQAGTYNCLATVQFYDGHEENAGFAFFDVSQPTIGSVSVENVNGNAGTFDVLLTDINCPSGATSIDVVAFTTQDLSDAHVYTAYWNGRGFVANINVGYHQYHFGNYGISATIHAINGTSGSAWQCGTIDMPQSQLGTFTADGSNYFMIADNTPANPNTTWVNFYVWNQGLSDLRMYRGFRDGNRWLAIVPLSDYMRTGTYTMVARSQMLFGPEIDLGATNFFVPGSSVGSVGTYGLDDRNGVFNVAINNPYALGGLTGIRTVVFSRSDWSDAFSYGCLDFGNGTYAFTGDIKNHNFNYGTYEAAVFVRNAFGTEELAGVTFFTLNRPNAQSWAIPVNGQADVVLASWDLPYNWHIMGIQYFVWNSGNDMRCYTTVSRQNDGSYNYTFSMSDFGKAGTFYVLPRIVRDNWSTEDLSLVSFNITDINGAYGIMGSSGTNINQMVRYFNKYGSYPDYYAQGNGGAPSVYDFCRIFYEECAAENVRAEVALCQAMKETGYLRFGGAVDPAAFNFAGIGAVDSSPGSYNWFPDIRTGIRAQVQHLKAYASTDSLNNACVDPRFNLVTRGVAPCVEDLGGRWASGANYGYSIRNEYMSKLFAS